MVGTPKILAVLASAMTLFTISVGSRGVDIGELERLMVDEHQHGFFQG